MHIFVEPVTYIHAYIAITPPNYMWDAKNIPNIYTARKACECVTVFNCITARLSRLYDGNGHRIDSHVFACIFRKCTTFARHVLVFGPVFILVCRRRTLVLPQYL